MQVLRTAPLALVMILATLIACGPGPDLAASPTVPPTPTAVLTPTPVFEAQVLGLVVLPDSQPGDWRVVGLLENRSGFAVSDVQLAVWLEDPRGDRLTETTVLPALPHLGPGEDTPFMARFRGVGAVSGANASVLVARRAPIQRAEAEVSEPEQTAGEDGSLLLLGLISNPGAGPIAIDSIAYLGVDRQGQGHALALAQAAPTWLEAGASSPFLAVADSTQEPLRWVPFVDALEQDPLPGSAIELVGPVELRLTAQGRPFAVGVLTNSSDQPRRPSLLVVVRAATRVLGVAGLDGPFPLAPGEQLPFGVADFPGLGPRLEQLRPDPASLSVEALVDPRASALSPDHRNQLEVQIDSFESVGSAVFLRGTVTNPHSVSLSRPSLYVALRTTEGDLLTAGWRELAAQLAGGGRLEFVVDLPFPQSGDLAMAEFDVVAFGLGP
jgi:hypothetical protein